MADESTEKKGIDWAGAAKTVGDIAGIVSGVGAIGSGIGAIGSMLGFGNSAKKQAEQQLQMQKDLMDYQNKLQVEQWNRENAYNSPQSQLERLKQAGLNPLFRDLDGNSAGGLTGGGAPAAPDMASMQNAFAASRKMQFEQLMQAKEMSAIDADIDLKKSQAEKNRADARGRDIQNEMDTIALNFKRDDDWFYHGGYFMYGSDGNIYKPDEELPEGVEVYDPKTYENMVKIHGVEREVAKLDQEVDNLRRTNRFESLREQNWTTLIENELRKSNADADTAEWAAKQAQQIFKNLCIEGDLKTVDLEVAKDTKNLSAKLGVVGDAVQILIKLVRAFK